MNYFWPGSVNTHWGPGPVNTNWGPGPINTNLGPRPGARGQAKGRGPGNTNTQTNVWTCWDERDEIWCCCKIVSKIHQKYYKIKAEGRCWIKLGFQKCQSLGNVPKIYFENGFNFKRKLNLTIFTWKNLCFTEKIHWNTRLTAFDVSHMFTQSIKFFKFHYRTDVWKTWFSNRQ